MKNKIDSLSQALHLLQVVADNPNTGLSELSRLSGLNKSRAYRMLCTLAEHHFVIQNDDSSYQLGHQLLTLGHIARSQSNWLNIAESIIEPLVVEFNENLQIRIRENLEIVQVWRRVSSQPLQVRSEAGNRRPLGAGAAGKILFTFAPDEVKTEFFNTLSAEQASLLQTKTQQIQQQGFYVSNGDLTEGVCAVAIPLYDAQKHCIACLSLSAPISRMPPERIQVILNRLVEARDTLFTRLGGVST